MVRSWNQNDRDVAEKHPFVFLRTPKGTIWFAVCLVCQNKPWIGDKDISPPSGLKAFYKFYDAHFKKKPACFKPEAIKKAREKVKHLAEKALEEAPQAPTVEFDAERAPAPAPRNEVVYEAKGDAETDSTGSTLELLEVAVEKYEEVKEIAIEREAELLEEIEELEGKLAGAQIVSPEVVLAVKSCYCWDPEEEEEEPSFEEMVASICKSVRYTRGLLERRTAELNRLRAQN
jgi:hypothetical protein